MLSTSRTRAEIEAVINALDYDFAVFDMPDFLQHLQITRNHPLIVNQLPLASHLFALWYPTDGADYVFVNATLHPTHQLHSLLHELAHILLGHRGTPLREILDAKTCRQLGIGWEAGHLRSAITPQRAHDPQEQEAEHFVLLIQGKLAAVRRLHELYGEPTSIAALLPYAQGLNYNG